MKMPMNARSDWQQDVPCFQTLRFKVNDLYLYFTLDVHDVGGPFIITHFFSKEHRLIAFSTFMAILGDADDNIAFCPKVTTWP